MKLLIFLSPILFLSASRITAMSKKPPKPDLIVGASDFRIDGATKRIFFKTQITNRGSVACIINGTFTIQTYLSADALIGNDIPSGGKVIPGSFTLEPGKVQVFEQGFYINYQSLEQLEAHPYCVIQIYNPDLNNESNYENNNSIYRHGFPRRKGEGIGIDPGNIPIQQASPYIDLKLLISNVTSQLVTEAESGKQYKEYTYTATIKNIGITDAVIDLQNPISLQYWTVTSCTDTTGMTSILKPANQHAAYIIKPGKSLELPYRKVKQKPDATTPLLIELLYNKSEKNKWNNFACLGNL